MEPAQINQFFLILSEALDENRSRFTFTPFQIQALTAFQQQADLPEYDIVNIIHQISVNALKDRAPQELLLFTLKLINDRWSQIKDKQGLDYTLCSNEQNAPYISFVDKFYAFVLANFEPMSFPSIYKRFPSIYVDSPKEDAGLYLNTYAVLIPTLTQTRKQHSKKMITDFDLNKFILSEDEKSLIYLENSQRSFEKNEGFLNADIKYSNRLFTPKEKERIVNKPSSIQPKMFQEDLDAIDYVLATNHRGPTLQTATIDKLASFLSELYKVEKDSALTLDAYKNKYWVKRTPLEPQVIQLLWEREAASDRDRARYNSNLAGPTENSKRAFEAKLKAPTFKLSEADLMYLDMKSRKNAIALIAANLRDYYYDLNSTQPEEYKRLQNQVIIFGQGSPKTWHSLLINMIGMHDFENRLKYNIMSWITVDEEIFSLECFLKQILEPLAKQKINSNAPTYDSQPDGPSRSTRLDFFSPDTAYVPPNQQEKRENKQKCVIS